MGVRGKDEKLNLISFEFNAVDSTDSYFGHSIRYNVRSGDRDWVFVTSSLIEERISKIKRHNLGKYFKGTLPYFIIVIGISVLALSFLTRFISKPQNDNYLKDIKTAYEKGLIKNTNELILQLEEKRIENAKESENTPPAFYYIGILFGTIVLLMFLFSIYLKKLYPLYNFCWGDYLDVFNKKESTRKTINTVIIIGLIISIIGSLIANKVKI